MPEELELDELEEEDELLPDDEPLSISEPSCGAEAKAEPSILYPGEYLPVDFINLS